VGYHDDMYSIQRATPVAVVVNIPPENLNFMCQAAAFRRIVMNLAGNSLKYTESGIIKVTLSVTAEAVEGVDLKSDFEERMVVLEISDTGKGISKEFLKTKIFTPFSQENTLSPGTGLGLSMVKSLVHLQHGTVTIDSQVGKGTTVTVSVPLMRAQHSSVPSPSTAPELKRHHYELRGFTRSHHAVIKDSVSGYLTGWFEMSASREHENEKAKIVVV
jgi:signal transduction histidine kinase